MCDHCPSDTTLAAKMAHGKLQKFDPQKESIKDFVKRYEFYCVAHGIPGDNADKKKANFVTFLCGRCPSDTTHTFLKNLYKNGMIM